jgi:hypothetical protein
MLIAPGPDGPILTNRDAVKKASLLQQKLRPAFDMIQVARRLRPKMRPYSDAKVLTDDRAPVNQLRKQTIRKTP